MRRTKDKSGFELTFPGAIYHVSRVQMDWAVKNNIREEDSYPQENILPIKNNNKLNLVDEEGELFPGFSVRICFGHTPGLMIPVIKFNDRTIVYTGDLVPTSAHIPLIWNMSYDIESLRTIKEKEKILNEALEHNYILVFQHDEHVECCTLEMTGKGIRIKDKFAFDKI